MSRSADVAALQDLVQTLERRLQSQENTSQDFETRIASIEGHFADRTKVKEGGAIGRALVSALNPRLLHYNAGLKMAIGILILQMGFMMAAFMYYRVSTIEEDTYLMDPREVESPIISNEAICGTFTTSDDTLHHLSSLDRAVQLSGRWRDDGACSFGSARQDSAELSSLFELRQACWDDRQDAEVVARLVGRFFTYACEANLEACRSGVEIKVVGPPSNGSTIRTRTDPSDGRGRSPAVRALGEQATTQDEEQVLFALEPKLFNQALHWTKSRRRDKRWVYMNRRPGQRSGFGQRSDGYDEMALNWTVHGQVRQDRLEIDISAQTRHGVIGDQKWTFEDGRLCSREVEYGQEVAYVWLPHHCKMPPVGAGAEEGAEGQDQAHPGYDLTHCSSGNHEACRIICARGYGDTSPHLTCNKQADGRPNFALAGCGEAFGLRFNSEAFAALLTFISNSSHGYAFPCRAPGLSCEEYRCFGRHNVSCTSEVPCDSVNTVMVNKVRRWSWLRCILATVSLVSNFEIVATGLILVGFMTWAKGCWCTNADARHQLLDTVVEKPELQRLA